MNIFHNAFPVQIKKGTCFTGLLNCANDPRIKDFWENTMGLNIVQIGAGGTGGYVAAEILRFLGGLPEQLQNKIVFTLMDGDKFEEKNLGRQLCTEDDIGEYKASTIIETYGNAFGCNMNNVQAIDAYLTDISQLFNFTGGLPVLTTGGKRVNNGTFERPLDGQQRTTIIIDCVDKTAPRKIIADYLHNFENANRGLADEILSTFEDHKHDIGKENKDVLGGLAITSSGDYVRVMYETEGNWHEHGKAVNRRTVPGASPNDIYLISSGNGQYTGQVYWGRIGFQNLLGQMNFKDLWGTEDVDTVIGNTISDEIRTNISRNVVTPMKTYQDIAMYLERAQAATNSSLRSNILEWTNINQTRNYIGVYTPVEISQTAENCFVVKDYAKTDKMNWNDYLSQFVSVPLPYDRFPILVDPAVDEAEEQMSCAERAEHNVQNINANKTAAMLVVNFFSQIFNGIYVLENENSPRRLNTVGVTFDIRTNNFTSEPLTTNYLRKEF